MRKKLEISIYDNSKFRVEEIEMLDIDSRFSYIEINNVIVEITQDQITLYSNDNICNNQISYLNFNKINDDKSYTPVVSIEKCLLLDTHFRNVYYHWIFDILPQFLVVKSIAEISVITLPLKFKFQTESLNYFNNEITIYNNPNIYYIEKLIIPNPTTKNLMPFNYAIKYLREKVCHGAHVDDLIYITRNKGFKRRILNENKLINYLRKEGFNIFTLEELSFQEQKRIFENAKLIISAHGSGLTNIIFSSERTTIIEIYGYGCGERCFAKIADELNMKYYAMQINSISYYNLFDRLICKYFPNHEHFNFKIDILYLKKYLNQHVFSSWQN